MIGLVLSCEHASWTLPPGIDLGVPDDVLRSQASWDPGAYDIAAMLGEALGLPVHTGAFSRMWVDLNRPIDHPDVVPRTSFGALVPGNVELEPGARAARLATYHAPYWATVERDVRARLQSVGACLHLSSHSFDPSLDPERRAFDVGVLYDPAVEFEADLAERLQFGMRKAGLAVRGNQPYRGTEPALVTSLRHKLGATRHREDAHPAEAPARGAAPVRYAGIELEASFAVALAPGGCARIAAAAAAVLEELREEG